ncbi:hypothetical protein [Lactobacillus buchneri CD034] [Lactiplantibacillus mudanjiangensis]|uniref:hypothetical protein n=1 Tax=Lactiplantibacillus mudanjiangensis TaxID=1296538 RepID=UPI0010152594|nr:hypothetical protein [Lactobacillus buchneri CD034] [Lactiplantibacillus mudanjiangensis]
MAVDVDIADVKGSVGIFQGFTDKEVNQQLALATKQATSDGLTDEILAAGIIQYTRHLLYVDWAMSYGGVQSASTLGNSQSNFNLLMSNDPYLLQYNATVASFGNGGNMGAVWTE